MNPTSSKSLRSFVLALSLLSAAVRADEGEKLRFFEARIRPVLVKYCYECHSHQSKDAKGGLRLDTREGIRKGGESGPSVVPGAADKSLLIAAIRHESFEMPPKQKLSGRIVKDFVQWIAAGAVDPRDKPRDEKVARAIAWRQVYEQRKKWWSLQPVVDRRPPDNKSPKRSSAIDRFVLQRLQQSGLSQAATADRRTLIRRLSFALRGLPPAPAEVRDFVNDASAFAYQRLVDRMLASPQFGERWARRWMDVVRFTDTYGYEWDVPAKGSWRYRDYLTRAFNQDVGFDQLVREQVAGDLLSKPRIDAEMLTNESLLGTMFFQMGEKRHGDSSEFNGIHQEMLDNKIDAFSKVFQATTIACARCHDHKLDAIPQTEYYALAGIFMSSRWVANTLDTPQRQAELVKQLEDIKPQLRSALADQWLNELRGTNQSLQKPAAGSVWSALLKFDAKKPPPLDDPRYPWFRLTRPAKSKASGNDKRTSEVTRSWAELSKTYRQQQSQRRERNRRDFQLVADFRKSIPEGWSVDGVGLAKPVPCGDFAVVGSGEGIVQHLFPGGLFSYGLSPRLNGVLRTPHLRKVGRPFLSFEHTGGDFAAQRTVIDNAFLTEKQVYLKKPQLGWTQISTRRDLKDRHVYIELATKTSNLNFPPRVGLGGPCSEKQAADPRSWFGVSRVFAHDKAGVPADELAVFDRLFHSAAVPGDLAAAAKRYEDWLSDAVRDWAKGQADSADVELVNWMLRNGVLGNQLKSASAEVARLVKEYRRLETLVATPQTAAGMVDLEAGYNYPLNIRGDYDQLGDPIPRGYLEMIAGSKRRVTNQGSGRLELARHVASPTNPLTARVYVNRVWQWLFGTGIVATSNDFGHLGERPSHPQLLDYLASRFVAEGWSTKELIKRIVLSHTYRQAGQTTSAARNKDPRNRLLHHFSMRRLEAEELRDSILAVSGRLDAALFGPAANPYRRNEDAQKRLFSGPVDGNGRRSLYTKITIMEPPQLLATFNQPAPKIPTGKRDVTTTPAQSLALLNDPFVVGQAKYWGKQLALRPDESVAARVVHIFRKALGRDPSVAELQRWQDAAAAFHQAADGKSSDVLGSQPTWTHVAHAMFNTKEFLYLR